MKNSSGKILIVDDEPNIHYSFQKILEPNHEIISAHNGLEGVELLKTQRPDVVVMDVKMPGMDGLEALKEMRKILTEKRLELLKMIKDKKPASVYELAKMVGRDIKNVLEDLAYLQEIGLVEITETRNKKIPHVDYDKIAFEVAI